MTKGVTRTGTVATLPFFNEMLELVYDLRWLILLCVVLIIVDLKFGIEASIKRGDKVRRSTMSRRTVNKFVDYLCWVFMAGVLGQALGDPFGFDRITIAAIVILLACLNEMDSILQNFCECRGIENISFRKFVIALIKRKNEDVGSAVEETFEDAKKKKNKKSKRYEDNIGEGL